MKKSEFFFIFIGILATLCLTLASFFTLKELLSFMDLQHGMVDQNKEFLIQTLARQAIGLTLLTGIIPALFLCLLAYLFNRTQIRLNQEKSQFQQSHEIFKAIQDDLKHMSITTDADGMITQMNEGAKNILGYQPEEVIQKQSILNFYDEEDLKDKSRLFAQQIGEFNAFKAFIASTRFFLCPAYEWIMKTKSSHLFPCYQTLFPLYNESHAISGYLLMALDISDFRKKESSKGNLMESISPSNIEKGVSSNHQEFFGWKVLVVDNDPDFRAILTAYLLEFGCQVMTASTGEEAIEMAKEGGGSNSIDLITLDMLMAPLNGYDIVQRLRNHHDLKNIPIAFISIIVKEIKDKIPGVLTYIDKPITKESVLQLLKKCQAMRRSSTMIK